MGCDDGDCDALYHSALYHSFLSLGGGQPGQIARFEFSTETKKGKHHHGRRADIIFVA